VTNEALQNYFREQQVSLQWLPVLRAMASELSTQTPAEELLELFSKIGERFAADTEDHFQDAETLTQLEESLNYFWARINWGWVTFREAKGCIEITHSAAPLAEAFGDEALGWSVGLLQGFYQRAFSALGASDTMVVRTVGEPTGGLDIHLRFGR
jgi:hypothetical protein